jgi:hypothetical protein
MGLIFKQVECTIDNAFNLRDLVQLKTLPIVHSTFSKISLKMALQLGRNVQLEL